MIPAGGRGEIEITLKTGRSDNFLSKSIYVYCNDPSRNIVVLNVTAAVQNGGPDEVPVDVRRSRQTSPPESEDLILDLLGVKP